MRSSCIGSAYMKYGEPNHGSMAMTRIETSKSSCRYVTLVLSVLPTNGR